MTHRFAYRDASFQAAGGLAGLTRLVNRFYDLMDSSDQFQIIRSMHATDLDIARDKLTRFLSLWTGGPKIYAEKYGPISITKVHAPFAIGEAERDAWLSCMRRALDDQPYSEAFKTYLINQLWIPAERIRVTCARGQAEQSLDH